MPDEGRVAGLDLYTVSVAQPQGRVSGLDLYTVAVGTARGRVAGVLMYVVVTAPINSASGMWPQESLDAGFGIQGNRLRKRRGQM